MKELHYRGRGRFLPGIPATDLTEADLVRLSPKPDALRQRLIKTGLYVPAKKEVTRE
ncbi:MAG: hypothetical protein ACO3HN_06345 [Opitutales bacterium]